MHLRDTIQEEDVKVAIELIEYSLRRVAMDEEGNLDVSIIEVGKSSKMINKMQRILSIIKELQDLEEWGALEDDIIQEAAKCGIDRAEVKELLAQLMREDKIYSPRGGHYKVMEES